MTPEEATVRAFIRKERQPRWLAGLDDPRRRYALVNRLGDPVDLDPRWMIQVPKREHSVDQVEATLRRLGAPAVCSVMSDDPDLDQHQMPLRAALDAVVGTETGALVICVPGVLAYYDGEAGGQAVLRRPPGGGLRTTTVAGQPRPSQA